MIHNVYEKMLEDHERNIEDPTCGPKDEVNRVADPPEQDPSTLWQSTTRKHLAALGKVCVISLRPQL